jgi:phosphate uptake regulator
VISLGKSTLVISLPSKWVREQNLKKGDEVDVVEQEGSLILKSSEHRPALLSKTIEIKTAKEKFIERVLVSCYVNGYDEIKLNVIPKSRIFDSVQRIVRDLIGMEIISQSHTSVLIKDLGGVGEQPIDKMIRRAMLLMKMMASDINQAVRTKQKAGYSFHERDKSINRLCYAILRRLNKELLRPAGVVKPKEIAPLFSDVLMIEVLSDDIARMGESVNNLVKRSKGLEEVIDQTSAIIKNLNEVYFKFDFDRCEKLIDEKYKLREKCNELFSKSENKDEANAIYWIREVIETYPVFIESLIRRNLGRL